MPHFKRTGLDCDVIKYMEAPLEVSGVRVPYWLVSSVLLDLKEMGCTNADVRAYRGDLVEIIYFEPVKGENKNG
jgi:hypothetical protein